MQKKFSIKLLLEFLLHILLIQQEPKIQNEEKYLIQQVYWHNC